MLFIQKKILFVVGFLFFFLSLQGQQSIDQLLQDAEKAIQEGDKNQEANCYNKLGFAYWDANNLNKATEYFKKSIQLNSEIGNKNAIKQLNNNIALIYAQGGQHAQAIEYFRIHLGYCKSSQEKASALINIASSLQLSGKHTEAIAELSKALDLAMEMNSNKMIRTCYGMMAKSYEALGKSEDAMKYYDLFATIDKLLKNQEMQDIQNKSQEQVNQANADKQHAERELDQTTLKLQETKDSLEQAEQIRKQQEMELELNNLKISQQDAQLRNERLIRNFFILGFIVVIIFLSALFFQFKKIRKQNTLLAEQNEKIALQNKQIGDSILYGQRIQNAILPLNETIENFFESFIFFHPKDIVSGDFYWFSALKGNANEPDRIFIAAVDCTGHGVPGAFMSMIGNSFLNEIVNERKITSPSQILLNLDNVVRKALKQDHTDNDDGMDVCLCKVEKYPDGKQELTFAGAKRPLLYYNSKSAEVEKINGDRFSIGGKTNESAGKEFIDKKMLISNGDILYLTSDGIVDQNSPDRKKLGTGKLSEFIREQHHLSMKQQFEKLDQFLKNHMRDEPQRDDMLVIGLKIK